MKHRGTRLLLFLVLSLSGTAFAQLEVSGGYTHETGNFGMDGGTLGAGWQFNRHVTLAAEGDFLWDNSKIGAFDLAAETGAVTIKSNSQNFLGGARVRIIGWKAMKELEKRKLLPFGEVMFGVSRLNQTVNDAAGTISQDASDSAFTWVLGGGVDYTLSAKWLARGKLDFVRTHFVDEGQSHLKVNIGIAYSF